MSERDTDSNANAPRNRSILSIPMDEISCSSGSRSSRSVGSYVGSIDVNSFMAPSNTTESDIPMVNAISEKATKNVFHLKMLVIAILIVSASTLAACAFTFIQRSETKQFESKFGYDAHKVFEAIGSSLDKTLGLMDSLAVTLVSYARDKNDKWPFVTLPDFGPRMAKLLPQTDAFTVTILPIVESNQRETWEAYSIENDGWVNQSITIQETWDGYYGPIVHDWEQYGTVHGDDGDLVSNVSRIMLPQWQNFPVIPEVVYAYNWDWLSISTPEALQACIDTQQSIISDTYMIPNPDDPESQAESEGWIDWLSGYISPSENAFEPVVDIYYPIVDDITHVDISKGNNYTTNRKDIVGVIAVSIYWREFIRDILPPGSDGAVIVIQSPCNLPFTYQLHGPNVHYLGVLDNHDSKYDHLRIETKIVDLKSFALRAGVYTGATINENVCPYTVSIYPSDVMKSDFSSQNGTIALIAVLLIFAFTSFIFIMYDYSVKLRQDKVMESAIRSSAIVDSLFPSTVRNQLYDAQEKKQELQQPTGRTLGESSNVGDDHSMNSSSLLSQVLNQASIAKVYPDTTVIFADIVGFTSWSSTREPTQVFHLLETIYAGFDALAKIYGVFKIETIGDSYVAVVGLPKAKKHHAVVMAKFANDCRTKMQELTHELEPFLGPGTADLALRIGLNSGPTTAGVLRGEKARFQLFGDTVNTASRMESNGAPNKIHVSESTALLIKSAGKEAWLTRRAETIMAKGKGEMQTYWCEPISSNTISEASH